VLAWVKPFASAGRRASIPVAYAWEPVILWGSAVIRAFGTRHADARDWCAESITLKRGLTGAKPQAVCFWMFEVMGLAADDELDDLFPGSGAVGEAWAAWRAQGRLAA
jgi:hypothetical protein